MIKLMTPVVDEHEVEAIREVLLSGQLVQSQKVAQFEGLVADYVGAKHAIATSSGTSALHIAIMSLDLQAGDEVIVPDFTWPSAVNVIEQAGAKPILVDIDLDTFNINIESAGRALSQRTKAIIPIHLFGLSADMTPLLELAKQHGLTIIEDAACALGSEYGGQRCGTIGDMTCFSFHPRKIITTGEGGMVATNNSELAEKLRLWRNHGFDRSNGKAQFVLPGLNYRMTEMQGAMGVVQMSRLDEIIAGRRGLAAQYQDALADIDGIQTPQEPDGYKHIWQSYVILLDKRFDRDAIIQNLRQNGIEATIGTYAVHEQPYYAVRGFSCPNSSTAYHQGLCLPLHLQMTDDDLFKIADNLAEIL